MSKKKMEDDCIWGKEREEKREYVLKEQLIFIRTWSINERPPINVTGDQEICEKCGEAEEDCDCNCPECGESREECNCHETCGECDNCIACGECTC